MFRISPKVTGIASLMMLSNATNPNNNLDGSLAKLPQAPVPKIDASKDYPADYNILAL